MGGFNIGKGGFHPLNRLVNLKPKPYNLKPHNLPSKDVTPTPAAPKRRLAAPKATDDDDAQTSDIFRKVWKDV